LDLLNFLGAGALVAAVAVDAQHHQVLQVVLDIG
jgi:hypothetical protein